MHAAKQEQSETSRGSQRSDLRILLAVIHILLLFATFFWLAGRWDWLRGWAYLVLFSCGTIALSLHLKWRSPELFAQRMKIAKGTKFWDRIWIVVFYLFFVSILIVAALDAGRFGWSTMPSWTWPVGALLFAASLFFTGWAMTVNPFFEKTVRIQPERGHHVIDSGPYAFVRHPGYVGIIPAYIFSAPLLLGSCWSLIPAFLMAVWLVLRTALEDRTLRRELPGYSDYAQRVRYRLIPGIW